MLLSTYLSVYLYCVNILHDYLMLNIIGLNIFHVTVYLYNLFVLFTVLHILLSKPPAQNK